MRFCDRMVLVQIDDTALSNYSTISFTPTTHFAPFHPYFVQQFVRSRVRTRFHGPFVIKKIDVFPGTKKVYPEERILKGPRKIGTQRKTPAFFASFLTK